MNPNDRCDPPSDYSDDEEKEEFKTPNRVVHMRRLTAPAPHIPLSAERRNTALAQQE